MAEVFISESSKDSDIASAVYDVLEKNNISCWMALKNLLAGIDFASEIDNAVKKAKIVLVILSKNSNGDQYVLNEINRAVELNKIILPFKIDETDINDDFKSKLDKAKIINAFPKADEHFDALVKDISTLLGK